MKRPKHELAGKKVVLHCKDDPYHLNGQKYLIEDWWINVYGKSWMFSDGNPAAMIFGMRSAFAGLPTDDEVVYGHTEDGLGHLIHQSELGAVVK